LGAAIKQLFRDVKTALTGKAPAAQPTQRRRRGEDTGQAAFRMAARKIVRRVVVTLPAEAYARATAYLSDTLDWLNLWQDQPPQDDPAADEAAAPAQHLYPHL
jgi:hypothetical protein